MCLSPPYFVTQGERSHGAGKGPAETGWKLVALGMHSGRHPHALPHTACTAGHPQYGQQQQLAAETAACSVARLLTDGPSCTRTQTNRDVAAGVRMVILGRLRATRSGYSKAASKGLV